MTHLPILLRSSFMLFTLVLLGLSVRAQQTVGVFINTEASFNGYTLISGINSDTTYLIDNCGYQVNSWASDLIPGLAAVLLENGDLVRSGRVVNPIFFGGGSGGMIQKFSWDGDLLWNYQHSDQTKHQHHDIEALPNGNILILAWEFRSAAEAVDNGRDPAQLQASIWPTRITEVTPIYPDDATVVWEWTMWDHLIQDYDSTKANFGVVAAYPELLDINFSSSSAEDWIHCNSVKYNSTLDQIVLSARNTNELYVIDHSTTVEEAGSHTGGNSGMGGDILYRWGNPMIYDRGDTTDQKFFKQHDVHWIPDTFTDGGKFLVFNNIWNLPDLESSINIVDPPMISGTGNYVDPGNSAFDPVDFDWHYVHPEFISGHMSSAQRLANGNTLINFADRGHLIEVDTSETLVWEYISAAGQGESIIQGNPASLNQIYRATRYGQNFPAFEDRDLTPGNLIEIDSMLAQFIQNPL